MVIITVRDPDSSNEFSTFLAAGEEEPEIIDVDFGYMNLQDREEFNDWAEGHAETAARLVGTGRPDALRAAATLFELIEQARADCGHE